jgi:quinol-cytochrome oxidoreductase complex cytochrome b subunit
VSGLRRSAKAVFESADRVFARAFSPAWNPLGHLGTLGWFFYWIVVVSGIYLYIFFDTGINQAYESLEHITHVQWYAGGIMRSLHRYASDALIIVMMLHLAREFVMDRYRGARWFTWFTGATGWCGTYSPSTSQLPQPNGSTVWEFSASRSHVIS